MAHRRNKKTRFVKRSFKKKRGGNRKRSSFRRRAIRTVTAAVEMKRRLFLDSFNVSEGSQLVYQPFNHMAQSVTDSGIVGNSIYVKSFQLRGSIHANFVAGVSFAGPLDVYIYLVKARDEYNTGALVEGFTSVAAGNTWFQGSTSPTTWYVNSSRCTILYRKHIKYLPDLNNAFSTGAANDDRAPRAYTFYCKKNISKMHTFKEAANGTPDAGFFGKYSNYYWFVAVKQTRLYADVVAQINTCSLVTYKDP